MVCKLEATFVYHKLLTPKRGPEPNLFSARWRVGFIHIIMIIDLDCVMTSFPTAVLARKKMSQHAACAVCVFF